MWSRILIPTDFSTAAEWAFDAAIRLATRSGAELLVLHIRMTRSSHPEELRLPADSTLYEYAEQFELEKVQKMLGERGSSIKTRLVVVQSPDAGKAIVETAQTEKADLIVIATHARHHVAHLLIGSTTISVLNDPPAPVLAIRYGVRMHEQLRSIVVPVHPTQDSRAALDLAIRVARENKGEIHLLTVCDVTEGEAAASVSARLAASVDESIEVKPMIVRGTDVAKEIVRYVDKHKPDALFLNAKAEVSEMKRDIVKHVGIPVMICP